MLVASEVGNFHSEFGQARPSGSRAINYVAYATDGRKDRQEMLISPLPTIGDIIKWTDRQINDTDGTVTVSLFLRENHFASQISAQSLAFKYWPVRQIKPAQFRTIKQESQLSQRDRAMLRAIKYFAK